MTSNFLSKKFVVSLLSCGAIAVLGACQPQATETVEPTPEEEPTTAETPPTEAEPVPTVGTVVDVAASNESFTTLVQAIEAAGLAETLSAEGPYTVFAPTNDAFAALPEGTLDQLLQPENQETLTQILTYHVLPQAVPAADVMPGDVETVAGAPITITVDEAGNVMVNEANVVQTDVQASNGVIHAIDQVLLPPDVQL